MFNFTVVRIGWKNVWGNKHEKGCMEPSLPILIRKTWNLKSLK